MHQGGDYTSYNSNNYPPPPPSQFPNPNSYQPDPNSLLPSTYASAPIFAPSDYSNYPPPPPTQSQTYPQHQPYHQVPDVVITPSPPVQTHSYNPPALVNPSFTAPVQQPTAFPSFESHSPHAPLQEQQQGQYYSQFDQHQGGGNYVLGQQPHLSASFPGSNIGVGNAPYSGSYNLPGYDSLYESSHVKFDQSGVVNGGASGGGGGGYFDNGVSRYDVYGNKSRSDLGSDYYGNRSDSGRYPGQNDDLYGDGVYAYQAKNKVEPYGARGTGSRSSTWTGVFDDYGRAISFPALGEKSSSTSSPKIVKAVPKVETQQDVQSGVQKFRVKLLAESGGQSNMDVLCQVGKRLYHYALVLWRFAKKANILTSAHGKVNQNHILYTVFIYYYCTVRS